jgi:transposase
MQSAEKIEPTYQELVLENLRLRELLEQVLSQHEREIIQLEVQIKAAFEQVAQLQKLFNGSKSERHVPIPGQLNIQLEMDIELPEPIQAPVETTTIERKKPIANPPGRKPLPKHLPRKTITIEPEGIDLATAIRIGEEVTEILGYKTGGLFVTEIIRPKYKTIDPQTAQERIEIGTLPSKYQIIPKSNASPELISHILISKYEDHLPLYRQRKMFLREKVDIPETTIGGWLMQSLNLLIPLYECLLKVLKNAGYLMADESPIAVLESEKKGATHKGYYWVYYDPISHLLIFQYHRSRAGEAPKEFLVHFKGYLQTDGYVGYDQFEANPDIVQLACMAHVRRKFFESLQNDKVRAEQALAFIGKLYDVEREARESKLTYELRKELRDKHSVPVITEMEAWMKKEYEAVLPKSSIGKAISYTLHLWDRIKNYLLDGKLEIDNNWIENKIRPLAIGRKNYLFAGSHESAQRAAMIYSFLAMCRLEAINPEEWLTDVLSRIQDYKVNKIEELLPKNWKEAQTITINPIN